MKGPCYNPPSSTSSKKNAGRRQRAKYEKAVKAKDAQDQNNAAANVQFQNVIVSLRESDPHLDFKTNFALGAILVNSPALTFALAVGLVSAINAFGTIFAVKLRGDFDHLQAQSLMCLLTHCNSGISVEIFGLGMYNLLTMCAPFSGDVKFVGNDTHTHSKLTNTIVCSICGENGKCGTCGEHNAICQCCGHCFSGLR